MGRGETAAAAAAASSTAAAATGTAYHEIAAPVRISTDLCSDGERLKPTSALRIANHHLDAVIDEILPPPKRDDDGVALETDLYCVGQACASRRNEGLREAILRGARVSAASAPVGGATMIPVVPISRVWVESVGNASLTFVHSIELIRSDNSDAPPPAALAAMRRAYVRVDASTGRPLPFSAEERVGIGRWREEMTARTTRRGRRRRACAGAPAIATAPELRRLELPPPTLASPLASSGVGGRPSLTVFLGPRHRNEGHYDHAALADVAVDAAVRRDLDRASIASSSSRAAEAASPSKEGTSAGGTPSEEEVADWYHGHVLTLRYVSMPRPGAEARCYVQNKADGGVLVAMFGAASDEKEKEEDRGAPSSPSGERLLVLAELSPPPPTTTTAAIPELGRERSRL